MIDTDKYEGHTEDIERWQMMARSLPAWTNDKDEQLVRDAPLLLEEVKQLREVIDKEHPTFDWSSRQTIANLDAEVKRLRERLDLAERYIIEPTLTRNYFADVVSKGLDDERDNLG